MGKKRRQVSIDVPVSIYQLLVETCERTGQNLGSVIRVAILFLHYTLSMMSKGYQVHFVSENETIIVPCSPTNNKEGNGDE